jgi:hypothetical protein
MSASVEVAFRKAGWNLVSGDFAIADKWTESRKAVVELNNLVEAGYQGPPWIKKDLSRKKKAISVTIGSHRKRIVAGANGILEVSIDPNDQNAHSRALMTP